MKATILYYSHKGKTANYAREIAMYLWSKGVTVSLSALSDFDVSKLKDTDFLIMGCWTSGWFFFNQHPHPKWRELVSAFPKEDIPSKILFFTTYKIRTGSMFSRMRKAMHLPKDFQTARLQSRTGFLCSCDKDLLDQFIGKQ